MARLREWFRTDGGGGGGGGGRNCISWVATSLWLDATKNWKWVTESCTVDLWSCFNERYGKIVSRIIHDLENIKGILPNIEDFGLLWHHNYYWQIWTGSSFMFWITILEGWGPIWNRKFQINIYCQRKLFMVKSSHIARFIAPSLWNRVGAKKKSI